MKTEEKINEDINLTELIQNLKKYILFCKSKWKIIITFSLLGLLFGYMYTKCNKPEYTAKLTFALENHKKMILGSSLMSNMGFDIGGTNENGVFTQSNIIELFKSRRIIEKTLLQTIKVNNKVLTLADVYLLTNYEKIYNSNRKYFFPVNQEKIKFTSFQNRLIFDIYSDLVNNLLVIDLLNTNSSLIKVELTSKDEVFSKYFLDALVKSVTGYFYEIKTKKLNTNTKELEKLVDSVRFELKLAVRNNSKESLTENMYHVNELEKQINIKILSDVLSDLSKQLELSKASMAKDMSLIQIIDTPTFPLEKTDINSMIGSVIGLIFGLIFILAYITFRKIITKLLLNSN